MEKDVETFEYTPKAAREEKNEAGEVIGGAPFRGKVVLKRISMLERYEKLPDLERHLADKAHVKAAIHAIRSTMDLWVSVDLTHVKSGKHYPDLKALMYDTKAEGIVQEVAFGLLQGFADEDTGN